jgi:UDP-3-O-[3-hydroxymyristoyl] glucosamine N-acyltransferase
MKLPTIKFMKFSKVYALRNATIINCEYVGDADFPIYGMNEIHVVEREILFS